MNEMEEFKQVFFTEAAELLADMEQRLLQLQDGSQDVEQLNAIFRCAHSIKGGSGAFGLDRIMRFTHKLEALLDAMRSGTVVPRQASIDALLRSVDVVNQMLACAQENREPPAELGEDIIVELEHFATGKEATPAAATPAKAAPAAAQEREFYIMFTPKPDLLSSGNEPSRLFNELSRLGALTIVPDTSAVPPLAELDPLSCYLSWSLLLRTTASAEDIWEVFEFVTDLAEISVECLDGDFAEEASEEEMVAEAEAPEAAVTVEAPASAPAPAAPKAVATAAPASPAPPVASSIRVDIDKIDKLVNMVGELVITEAMLRAQTKDFPEDKYSNLLRGMDELSHHTRELQEAVMSVRMQPVKSIFSRMPRIVRDTASQLGKDVQLLMSGEGTEVDKTVIELLGDPLTHMIRNSVDHGIEMPDTRVDNNKSRQGTIHLSAYHRSGRIIIDIADDGAGINRERVLRKAVEKGLVSAEATLSDEEIDHLIFLPGFSTAEQVTSVSGRGVGMDVVKRNIESLGGTVRITNTPGKGSIFSVSLPLTLAILDGMIVGVGDETYIVPINNIIETLRPNAKDVHRVQGRADVLNVRGEFVPLVYLHDVFGIADAQTRIERSLIVLVESAAHRLGLVVDTLIGQQQVVIKSLQANADPVEGISGATILGDGHVSLILEINELWGMQHPSPKHPDPEREEAA